MAPSERRHTSVHHYPTAELSSAGSTVGTRSWVLSVDSTEIFKTLRATGSALVSSRTPRGADNPIQPHENKQTWKALTCCHANDKLKLFCVCVLSSNTPISAVKVGLAAHSASCLLHHPDYRSAALQRCQSVEQFTTLFSDPNFTSSCRKGLRSTRSKTVFCLLGVESFTDGGASRRLLSEPEYLY